jgi:hypothetical protein
MNIIQMVAQITILLNINFMLVLCVCSKSTTAKNKTETTILYFQILMICKSLEFIFSHFVVI